MFGRAGAPTLSVAMLPPGGASLYALVRVAQDSFPTGRFGFSAVRVMRSVVGTMRGIYLHHLGALWTVNFIGLRHLGGANRTNRLLVVNVAKSRERVPYLKLTWSFVKICFSLLY